jgi:hypothetical protein
MLWGLTVLNFVRSILPLVLYICRMERYTSCVKVKGKVVSFKAIEGI